jgi:hypothetical protein
MFVAQISNQITLCSQGHAEDVMPSIEPQSDRKLTVAARFARVEIFKEDLTSKRDDIIRQLAELLPGAYRIPAEPQPAATFSRKLPIPHLEYPSHNFVGWLIGTGGKSKQELERRTGAKVSVRYTGSLVHLNTWVLAQIMCDRLN